MSEVNIIRGQGPYEKQTGLTEVFRPFLLAVLYAAVILFVYMPIVFVEAALVSFVFGPILIGAALGVLLRVTRSGGEVSVRLREIDTGKRILAALVLAGGILFFYLDRASIWRWTYEIGMDKLWVGSPFGGWSMGVVWQGIRLAVALALPIALIPAGIELLARLLMEIGAPNLANSIRAASGILLRRRWLGYRKEDGKTEVEIVSQPTPPANWN